MNISEREVFLELEQRYERFHTILNEFEDLQGQIDDLSDNLDTQYTEREAFEGAFHRLSAKARCFLRL